MEWTWLKDWWRLKSIRKRRKLQMQRNNVKHLRAGRVAGCEQNGQEPTANSGGHFGSLERRNSAMQEDEDDDDDDDVCYCDECIANVGAIGGVNGWIV